MSKLHIFGTGFLLMALTACAEKEVILPGERLDPRAMISPDGPATVSAPLAAASPVALPAAKANAEWSQTGGNPAHSEGHVALGGGTSRIWSAPIGQGSDRKHRITADPVVAAGRIFTLDSRARVTATSPTGATLWTADLTPGAESPNNASGGGIAYDGGRAFVTTGFGELVALDAASGQVVWRQRVGAPVGGAPAAAGGMVYAVGRDGTGWGVRAQDGKVMWRSLGNKSTSGVVGVSAPAVADGTVVMPFASGQLLAVDAETGDQIWSADVGGTRVGRSIALIRDMTGDPVIVGQTVLAGTSGGRMGAFDLQTGAELWRGQDGANSPVVVVDGSVFAVNDQAQLVRMDLATGARIWAVDLPYYVDEKVKKQETITASYGPVLAGGRLLVASSDGVLRAFDPSSGSLVGQGAIPGGAATAPVVAGQTLYVTGRDGNLHAFR